MSKSVRQYIGIVAALIAYYIIHEGAHLITALCMGVFKEVNFLGLGMQIDVSDTQMTDCQMAVFCLMGAAATLVTAVMLTIFAGRICSIESKLVKAIFLYTTIIMLMLDPLYLGVLCDLFGGGDMNGIQLLIPKKYAIIFFDLLLTIGILVFIKWILPLYKKAFKNN